jgi:hypothetical protein
MGQSRWFSGIHQSIVGVYIIIRQRCPAFKYATVVGGVVDNQMVNYRAHAGKVLRK